MQDVHRARRSTRLVRSARTPTDGQEEGGFWLFGASFAKISLPRCGLEGEAFWERAVPNAWCPSALHGEEIWERVCAAAVNSHGETLVIDGIHLKIPAAR